LRAGKESNGILNEKFVSRSFQPQGAVAYIENFYLTTDKIKIKVDSNLSNNKILIISPSIKVCFELLPLNILDQKLEVTLVIALNQPGRKIYEFVMKESANYPVYTKIHAPTLNCSLIMMGQLTTHVYCKEASNLEDTVKILNQIFSSREMFEARIYRIEPYFPITEPLVRLLHAIYLSTMLCMFEETLFFIHELKKKFQEDLASSTSFKKDPGCLGSLKREFRELKKRVERKELVDLLDQVQAFAKIYASCKA